MPEYEGVPWQTEYFSINLGNLQRHLRSLGCSDLADQVTGVAEQPGPLNVFLARGYWQFSATNVLAKFIAAARGDAADTSGERIVSEVVPLLRWDLGMEPIEWALREMQALTGDAVCSVQLAAPSGIVEVVEALWLLGLYRFTLEPEDPSDVPLTGLMTTGSIPELRDLGKQARSRLLRSWTRGDGGSPDCPTGTHERLRLNAAGMLRRHDWLENGSPDVFRHLLQHILAGGTWALPCEANDKIRREAGAQGLSGFWREQGTMVFDGEYSLEVGFLSDPLQILNLGNAFDTCLRVGGDSEAIVREYARAEALILGSATNANIRVVVARGSDGRVLGRRTLGLSLENGGGFVESPTYPKGHTYVQEAIDEFIQRFVVTAGLWWSSSNVVKPTCAPFYDEFRAHGTSP